MHIHGICILDKKKEINRKESQKEREKESEKKEEAFHMN